MRRYLVTTAPVVQPMNFEEAVNGRRHLLFST